MAYYTHHTPRVTVSGLPSHVSKPKLIMKLEEAAGKGKVLGVDYITKTCARVILQDDEAQRKLLDGRISMPFGGKSFPIVVEKMVGDSSDDEEEESDISDCDVFRYQPSDKESKGILRYFSKTQEHEKALNDALKQCNSKLISLSSDEVEAMLPKVRRGGRTPEQICEDCITKFMDRFSSWNEKLEDCTSAEVTHIISVLAKYRSKCFGTWFKDSKTILVTGPAEVVDELKQTVKNYLDKSQRPMTVKSGKACPFQYDKIPPAVMRFVSKQDVLKSNLSSAMAEFAQVQISEEDNTLAIQVTPDKSGTRMQHSEFEKKCESHLKMFFRHFDTWKGKFNIDLVKAQQQKTPDLFKTTSQPDHFVKWFPVTGTVIVTGTVAQVQRCRQLIEQILGVQSSSPQRQAPFPATRSPSIPGVAVYQPLVLPPTPFLLTQTPVSQVAPNSQNTPSSSQQTQRTQRISSADSSDETNLRKADRILFDTEEILPAILKFVSSDSDSKKRLEKCSKRLAKVIIKNDHGQIKVHVMFKKKDFSLQDKAQVFTAVQKYFDKFSSVTKKYDKKKLRQVVEQLPTLFDSKAGVYVKSFLETGTVKITGLTENVTEKEKELDFEMNSHVEVERIVPADVFIAQRQCLVWERVEKLLEQNGLKISITLIAPGKIQYKGSRPAIRKAKESLGLVSETLFQNVLTGLSTEQIEYLRRCEKSQKQYIQTGKNMLDPLYRVLKDDSIQGSLAFRDDGIDLICPDRTQWMAARQFLEQNIVHFETDLSRDKPEVPFIKQCKIIKGKMEDEPVYIKELPISKKIQVFCLQHQRTETELKIIEIRSTIADAEDEQKFYPMEEHQAKHILNPHSHCKVYKAKSVKLANIPGQCGLLVTCEKEDIDSGKVSLFTVK